MAQRREIRLETPAFTYKGARKRLAALLILFYVSIFGFFVASGGGGGSKTQHGGRPKNAAQEVCDVGELFHPKTQIYPHVSFLSKRIRLQTARIEFPDY